MLIVIVQSFNKFNQAVMSGFVREKKNKQNTTWHYGKSNLPSELHAVFASQHSRLHTGKEIDWNTFTGLKVVNVMIMKQDFKL